MVLVGISGLFVCLFEYIHTSLVKVQSHICGDFCAMIINVYVDASWITMSHDYFYVLYIKQGVKLDFIPSLYMYNFNFWYHSILYNTCTIIVIIIFSNNLWFFYTGLSTRWTYFHIFAKLLNMYDAFGIRTFGWRG